MLKTLLITHEYYPFAGGVARYCYNLFKFFPQDKYLVICDHPQVVSQGNVIHLKLKDRFIYPSWLWAFFRIRKIVKQQKIEQILTPNILPLGSMAYLFFKVFKIPYVISLHGLDINLALARKPKLAKMILSHAKQIICNSQYTASRLNNLSLDDKVTVIYPSLTALPDIDKVEALKAKFHIQPGDRVLLTIARLNYRKGHDLVIKAIKDLKQWPIKYLIVGSGDQLDKLKSLVQALGLSEQVIFCGSMDDDYLASFYKLADIFVMPHRQIAGDVEGLGMVYLEAASFSLPIIAGDSGGIKEIFKDQLNIFLIPNDDLSRLKEVLTKLLNDDKLRLSFGQAAHELWRTLPTAASQSEKLAKILS